jgi:hypothetical protein
MSMQSSWPGAPSPIVQAPAARVSRPVTLAIAVWGALIVDALMIVGAVFIIVSGKDTIRDYVQDTVGNALGADVIESTIGEDLDQAYHKLVIKAVVAIVLAVAIGVFALLSRNGGLGPRIGLAVTLVAGMCGGSGLQLGEMDILPQASIIVAGVTPLLSLIAIVCAFLPPSNRYGKARKAQGR